MDRRELKLSNKKLQEFTPEDIILKSPLKIPPKELQDLLSLGGVNNNSYAYYDLSETEKRPIIKGQKGRPIVYNKSGYSITEGNVYMGNNFDDI